ncbi:MAG: ABC transporter [Thermobacillus sp. ZCTH02-B1]|uniref:ABC transporter ATP-binding protein n=1 Tax=Thermobacillus sp. ZCTH02-B1 TaxID=1858795 RepID=UPI000B584779|nr:ABC transporter ATP-binding protein [Thermobacillus sp. ZCTH02-B1]OUM97397.1 MAG: ABC transporter [Thermobacillus sp. ZCTH02-B1]
MSHHVVINNVVKKYGDTTAVKGVQLSIRKGEFFTILGPSGCGKTTLLRMIAGFNSIDEGEILFDGKRINDVPAHLRNIGMVFQNYAIFPHMSIFKNVAYGLKARKVPKQELEARVNEALELMKISQFRDRDPSQLSGGQQQRVALARALVIRPVILLMDEPLSNLDAKLRVEMRNAIKKIQRELGITTIYVTHDQEEALAVSDRIAVMNQGRVEQIGTPQDIYMKPATPFVAGFIGTTNFLSGVAEPHPGGGSVLRIENAKTVTVPGVWRGRVIVGLRPEHLHLTEAREGELTGTITLATFLGDFINYEIELTGGKTIEVNEYTKDTQQIRMVGQRVSVMPDLARMNLYPDEGEGVPA